MRHWSTSDRVTPPGGLANQWDPDFDALARGEVDVIYAKGAVAVDAVTSLTGPGSSSNSIVTWQPSSGSTMGRHVRLLPTKSSWTPVPRWSSDSWPYS